MTDSKTKDAGNLPVSRCDFLKFCSSVAGAMGLGPLMGPKVAEALTAENRPPVLWLHFADYGGLAAAAPNPTGAKGLRDALPGLSVPVVNEPGCPPNPVNVVAVIADYLMNGIMPQCDAHGRHLFAYGTLVHEQCPNSPIRERHGHCLEYDGCKGRECYNNCPSIQFNEETNFPMKAGHPCIGCSEPDFWDTMTPFYVKKREGLIERIKDRLGR